MINSPETNSRIATLVRAAAILLEEAENLHGQPLYYTEDGFAVDVERMLEETARAADAGFEEGQSGPGFPEREEDEDEHQG